MKKRNFIFVTVVLTVLFASCEKESNRVNMLIDFEDLVLEPDSFWNGSDGSGYFISGECIFINSFTDWGDGITSWEGFSYANMTDIETEGIVNQYSTYAGEVANQSGIFAVSYGESEMLFVDSINGVQPQSCFVTNTTYAALSMKNGDLFAKKFGGADGNDPDWFKLTISGIGTDNIKTGDVEFYLADFTDPDSANDYIVKVWQKIDLTSLGNVKRLKFSLSSSDVGDWGMFTPAYFCLDDLYITLSE